MAAQDDEIEILRSGISCAVLLERLAPVWHLDRRESTRRALKYRRGPGEIVIVNHDGRGWWDPQSAAKGDVFDLAQHLDPSLNFGQVRQVLRPFVGLTPTFPEELRLARPSDADRSVAERWQSRPRFRAGAPAWRYLAEVRRLPSNVLMAAGSADVVREGPYGSAWFAHRDASGSVRHIEIRGPDFKGAVRGGEKTLFRLAVGQDAARLVVTEAPIDALSLAALEDLRADTVYLATGGGMGPGTLDALARELGRIATFPNAVMHGGTDANAAGERYAARHAGMAAAAGVAFARLAPITGIDWNDVLKQARLP